MMVRRMTRSEGADLWEMDGPVDLDPIERVRKLTRRVATHNRYFPTIEDVSTRSNVL